MSINIEDVRIGQTLYWRNRTGIAHNDRFDGFPFRVRGWDGERMYGPWLVRPPGYEPAEVLAYPSECDAGPPFDLNPSDSWEHQLLSAVAQGAPRQVIAAHFRISMAEYPDAVSRAKKKIAKRAARQENEGLPEPTIDQLKGMIEMVEKGILQAGVRVPLPKTNALIGALRYMLKRAEVREREAGQGEGS